MEKKTNVKLGTAIETVKKTKRIVKKKKETKVKSKPEETIPEDKKEDEAEQVHIEIVFK